MALSAVPWRAGKAGRSAGARAVQRPERTARPPKGAAASAEDRFMDVVVLISVVLFLLLAVGIGLLVLRSTVSLP